MLTNASTVAGVEIRLAEVRGVTHLIVSLIFDSLADRSRADIKKLQAEKQNNYIVL